MLVLAPRLVETTYVPSGDLREPVQEWQWAIHLGETVLWNEQEVKILNLDLLRHGVDARLGQRFFVRVLADGSLVILGGAEWVPPNLHAIVFEEARV